MTLPVPADDHGKPIADRTPWRIGPSATERARICIQAAEMRARSVPYNKIAERLGLENGQAAKKCAEAGFGLAPGEDLRMARRVSAARLDQIATGLWDTYDDPGPMVNVGGIVRDHNGEPVLDRNARVAALRGLIEVDKEYRKLHGADAPRQSVSVVATAPLEEIQAAVERMRAEVAQAEQEAALSVADGDGLPEIEGGL